MNEIEYEIACGNYLKTRGFEKVEVTKASGDQGLDVIAYKDGLKYGIQCKLYSKPVGNKAVQEAHAGASFYKCDKAIVMTNNTFTKSAQELATNIGVELWPNMDEKAILTHSNHQTVLFTDVVAGLLLPIAAIVLVAGVIAAIFGKYVIIILGIILIISAIIINRQMTRDAVFRRYDDLFKLSGVDWEKLISNGNMTVDDYRNTISKLRNYKNNSADMDRKTLHKFKILDIRLCNMHNQIIDRYYNDHPNEMVNENNYWIPEK